MRRLTIDPATLAKLQNLDQLVEMCDECGRVLGYFHPAARANAASQAPRSPVSDEELRQRRQQRTGRPLAEILEGLGHL